MSFSDLGLSDKVLAAVTSAGYVKPTPIQEQAIPHVLARRDVLGIAQTGTGKTAAFVLPMLTMLEKGRARARMPRTLILELTRELAAQVKEQFDKYGAGQKLNVALMIGGCEPHEKRDKLRRLLRDAKDLQNAIIFCNRKREVALLYKSLQKHGFSVGALHGDMDQSARTAALDQFRKGEIPLLVASDVAARGLDIPTTSHVFNFDVPHHAADYVHPTGRTGRAGRAGTAISIVTPLHQKSILAIAKLIGQPIPRAEGRSSTQSDATPAAPSSNEAGRTRETRAREGAKEGSREGSRGGRKPRREREPRRSRGDRGSGSQPQPPAAPFTPPSAPPPASRPPSIRRTVVP